MLRKSVAALPVAVLALAALLSNGQSQEDKSEFEKFQARAAFTGAINAWENLLFIRLRLSSPARPDEMDLLSQYSASALLMPAFSNPEASGDIWALYFRECPALLSVVERDQLSSVAGKFGKLRSGKTILPGGLFESWMADLRFLFLHPERDALLEDRTRSTYLALLVFGAWKASAGDSIEAKTQRMMFTAAMKPVKPAMAKLFDSPSENLSGRAAVLSAALGDNREIEAQWKEFLGWFNGNR